MEFLNVLSREEMKNIKGGGCVIYCCTGGPGSCSQGNPCPECSGSTSEECQTSAVNNNWTCEEGYVAALFFSEN